jgi:hypothetical protein
MTREEIFQAIAEERDYQVAKWGSKQHFDKNHSLSEWFDDFHLYRYFYKAQYAASEGYTTATTRNIRKIAALCVAILEIHGCPRRKDEL